MIESHRNAEVFGNKAAWHRFEIIEKFEAGLRLTGAEVKSLRERAGSLRGSFVKILGKEAFVLGMQISPYRFARSEDYDSKRTRKLLLTKQEIERLRGLSSQRGFTLIPLSVFFKDNIAKMIVGVGRGKKLYDQRKELKEKDMKRDVEVELRGKS